MKNTIIKIISMLLIAVMLCQMAPATVFAAENDPIDLTENGFDYSRKEVEPAETGKNRQPNIQFEDASRREEDIKHFRLSDGSYIAVQYDTAVHYKDDSGQWVDIDNTLKFRDNNNLPKTGAAVATDFPEAYTAQNSDHILSFPAELREGILFDFHDAEHQIQMRLGVEDEIYAVSSGSDLAMEVDAVPAISYEIHETKANVFNPAEINNRLERNGDAIDDRHRRNLHKNIL